MLALVSPTWRSLIATYAQRTQRFNLYSFQSLLEYRTSTKPRKTGSGGEATAKRPNSHPQEQDSPEDTAVISKDYDNVRTIIRFINPAKSQQVSPITLAQDILTVYQQLPVIVTLSLVIDGQQVASADGTEHRRTLRASISSYTDARYTTNKRVDLHFTEASGLGKYHGYQITRYTAESSGSTTTPGGPKLTLYLKSPAVQQQEEEALRAEEEQTGWVTHVCHKARRLRRPSQLHNIQIPRHFLDRAFHGALLDDMPLKVAFYKDGQEVEGMDTTGLLKLYKTSQGSRTRLQPVVLTRRRSTAALAGCRLQQVKAKPPDLIQVHVTSVAGSQQQTH